MNRLSIQRKLTVFLLRHPKMGRGWVKAFPRTVGLPKGYRKIVKK